MLARRGRRRPRRRTAPLAPLAVLALALSAPAADAAPKLYVGNFVGGSMTVMDSASGSLITNVFFSPERPSAIAVAPNGQKVYVAVYGDGISNGSVFPVDAATNAVGAPIAVGVQTSGIAVTPDSSRVWVANRGTSGPGTVQEVDPVAGTASAPIPIGANGSAANGIAITPDGTTAYVTHSVGPGFVTPIDVATKVKGTPIPVTGTPLNIAITPNGRYAYTANTSGSVSKIDLNSGTEVKTITGVGSFTYGIAISPDGTKLYVTSRPPLPGAQIVTPITLPTDVVGTPIPVPSGPSAVAFNPDGAQAWVTSQALNKVTPIAVGGGTAGTPIGVGSTPVAVAVAPDTVPGAQPPIAQITSPAPGGSYYQGQPVNTAFSCAEGAGGPGLRTCSDTNGSDHTTGGAKSGSLYTGVPGPRRYSVTARSTGGLSGSARISFNVAGLPSVSIAGPPDDRWFRRMQSVPTSFTCTEGAFGPGLTSCNDSNGSSHASAGTFAGSLNTLFIGTRTYEVIGTSASGGTKRASITYKVAEPPQAAIRVPEDNTYYALGSNVPTDYECLDGPGGPGIQSCVNSDISAGGGTALKTDSLGLKTFAVKATSKNGFESTTTHTYGVARRPTVSIDTPTPGQSFAAGLTPAPVTSFTCTEGEGGPGIRSCLDQRGLPSGSPLPIGNVGPVALTVTAVSEGGLTTTATVDYSVVDAGCPTPALPHTDIVAVTAFLPVGACAFTRVVDGSGRPTQDLQTTSPLLVNGIPLSAPTGGAYTVSSPSAANPGGFLGLSGPNPSASLTADALTFPLKAFGWSLPATRPGAGGTPVALTGVGSGNLALLRASIREARWLPNRTAAITLNVQLPDVFSPVKGTASCDAETGEGCVIAASGVISTSRSGPPVLDGLQVNVENVYLGPLIVNNLCFSYDAGTGGIEGCRPPFGVDFLEPERVTAVCNGAPLPGQPSYSGAFLLSLPFAIEPGNANALTGGSSIGAYLRMINGNLTGGGATYSGPPGIPLGNSGVSLEAFDLLVCRQTAGNAAGGRTTGLLLSGGASLGFAERVVGVDGSFTFDAPFKSDGSVDGWTSTVAGAVQLYNVEMGNGSVTFGNKGVGVSVGTTLALPSPLFAVVAITGTVGGSWDYGDDFSVFGEARLKVLGGLLDGTGRVLIGTKHVGGCIQIAFTARSELYIDSNGNISWNPVERTSYVSTGFDYNNASKKVVVAGTCDLGALRAANTRAVAAGAGPRATAGARTFRVAADTAATLVEVKGTAAPPRVKVVGPGGRTITSPADGSALRLTDGTAIAQDPSTGTTNVMLVRPRAGTWTVTPEEGSPEIASVATAPSRPAAVVVGKATSLGDGKVRLKVGHLLAPDQSVALSMTGPGEGRQRLGTVRGGACKGLGRKPRKEPYTPRCITRTVTVPYGPDGVRTVWATISRNGVPQEERRLGTVNVRFKRSTAPSVRVSARGSRLTVSWNRVRHAAAYAVTVQEEGSPTRVSTTKRTSATFPFTGQPATVKVVPTLEDGTTGDAGVASPPGCGAITGTLSGTSLGPLRLGTTLAQAQSAMRRYKVTGTGPLARFCVEHGTVVAQAASPRAVAGLPAGQRRALTGRVAAITTTDASISVRGITVGAPAALAAEALGGASTTTIGRVTWRVLPVRGAKAVVRLEGGAVKQIGIVDRRLLATARQTRLVLPTLR